MSILHLLDVSFFFFLCQITKWQKCLKFPEEPKISNEAKDLICHLLCDVDTRLGTKGVEEIKVPNLCTMNWFFLENLSCCNSVCNLLVCV